MANTIYTSSGSQRSVSITTSTPIDNSSANLAALESTLDTLNATAPLSSVIGDATSCTLTLKDGRSLIYTCAFGASPPATTTFCITSAVYWSSYEFSLVRALATAVTMLQLQSGMSAMTITYV